TALNDGNPFPGYSGTVTFSSDDPTAQLPPPSPLSGGTGVFSATFRTSGVKSLSAADLNVPGSQGTQTGIVVTPAVEPVGVALIAVVGAVSPADGVVATFTSLVPEPPGAYSALIKWGGTDVATPGKVVQAGAGYNVLGMHSYKLETNFPVDVTITDTV